VLQDEIVNSVPMILNILNIKIINKYEPKQTLNCTELKAISPQPVRLNTRMLSEETQNLVNDEIYD